MTSAVAPPIALTGGLTSVGQNLPDWLDPWVLVAILWIALAVVGLWWLRLRRRHGPGGTVSPTVREQPITGDMLHPYETTPRRAALILTVFAAAGLLGMALTATGVTGDGADPAGAWLGPLVLGVVLLALGATALWWLRAKR